MKGSDGWDPKSFYDENNRLGAVQVSLEGNTLSWNGYNKAICYLVFCNGTFYKETTETTLTVEDANAEYTVKAVNKYGVLGE
ncbi:hypothetical protein [uncultured Bacteroides sp.]|uniref:hypothetical protein n=1 Tax=uncultured Bacteroides sp. TaxID=162156 RepID=UPI0026292E4C|nr:hypothetical protein [uncultured Bacteroides sp.]